jgi:hypothetical protein
VLLLVRAKIWKRIVDISQYFNFEYYINLLSLLNNRSIIEPKSVVLRFLRLLNWLLSLMFLRFSPLKLGNPNNTTSRTPKALVTLIVHLTCKIHTDHRNLKALRNTLCKIGKNCKRKCKTVLLF